MRRILTLAPAMPVIPLFLAVLLGGILPAAGLAPTSSIAKAASPPPTAKYVCLIVLDAGRPDYITNHLSQMPTMRAFLQHARWYNRAWVGDLMSITPPGHAVIGSGSFPKDDGGIVNWDWGVHSTGKISPTFQALANYQNGWTFKLEKDSGTPTLSQLVRKKYPNGLAIAGSGAHFHAAGPMGGPYANWIFAYDRINGYWAPYSLGQHRVPAALLNDPSLKTRLVTSNHSTVPLVYDPLPLGVQDSLVVDFAIKSLQLYKPRATMINLPEVDTIGHWSHQWKRDEGILYRSFDRDFARLLAAYQQAGIYNQTMFVITADHGMIQSKYRVIDREAVIKQIKDTLGKKSIILTNGGGTGGPTMTSIWLKNPANNARMAKALFAKQYDNVSAIFYIQHNGTHYYYNMAGCESCSLALVKTYRYLLSTEAGTHGEDIAILLREDARNSGLPQMMGRHGGADWGSQHITLILSGPGIKAGTSDHPGRLADIAPTIERGMGITPDARDGVVLADAFQQPNPADVASQASSDATQDVYVSALSQRAQSDISLEKRGLLANFIPSDEIIIHWKRRLAVTIGGAVVLIGTLIGLAFAVVEVRKQGTALKWTA
ncbi:MAG: alkaline phosphatase family protein [Chloroflexota bacterium]|nr:alkaline phosphatase family protein [Chloroflexota bacterium]